jgi:hypothetical protein
LPKVHFMASNSLSVAVRPSYAHRVATEGGYPGPVATKSDFNGSGSSS